VDKQRFVEMLDKGQYNARALATRVVGLQDMMGAYEEVAYRTTVTAIMNL
jgi:threonine dehydrogenase-like Zn-dependent dehydrogenase